MRTALFWAIKQRGIVIPYRRFGTTSRSRLKGSRPFKMNVGKELPTTRCVIARKSAILRSKRIWNALLIRQLLHHIRSACSVKLIGHWSTDLECLAVCSASVMGKNWSAWLLLVRRGLFRNCIYWSIGLNTLVVRMSAIVVWLRISNLEVLCSVPLSIIRDASCFIYCAVIRPRLHWYSKWVSYLYH